MQKLVIGSLAMVVALAGCSRKEAAAPAEFVDSAKVGSILMTLSEADSGKCAAEIEAKGAKVLYRSAGLLFTDRKADSLRLSNCSAVVSANETLTLDTTVPRPLSGAQPTSVETLLKLIPAEKIGARTFVKNNPTYDGRGVLVAVLDTGVELDHPMLRKTSSGEEKVVTLHDFTGQGRVELKAAAVTGETLTVPDGTDTYKVGAITGAVKFGIFPGSTMSYSEDVSAADTFKDIGVITYQAADGSFRGKIDSDDDKDFTDEPELYDFEHSRAFTKIGDNRSLTVSLNINETGEVASLAFDDGGHGTHVAGISTGFDPNGLSGVAPGARVLGAKIGDNRLSGGSTTTASMLLAIDFAVSRGAQVINLSYGIRGGSNVGKSAIDQYVDKVAREKGVLFSISAGNAGPGLLTVGTPAGAELVITNAAYLPKESAESNYGYIGLKKDSLWYFSSVGPLLDGGWKPTLLAPGTALSSVPGWDVGLATYSGTSMASPQVTGGLALLLSAAQQAGLPTDRSTVTRAVYASATHISDLAHIEQGHGLMNVPGALESLKKLKGQLAIDYSLSVPSSTAPGGKGKGIYIRSRRLPVNDFSIAVTPTFPQGTTAAQKNQLKTYRLESSAKWITTPPDFHLLGQARGFRAEIDPAVMKEPGLHSEKITATDEATGLVAFEVPVTVVVPKALTDENQHELVADVNVEVGTTHRIFVDVPAGTTALQFDLTSDGQSVWAQLLDSEGEPVSKLQDPDRQTPQAPLLGQLNTTRSGVYEIDVVAPPFIHRPVGVKVRLKAFSLKMNKGAALGENTFEVAIDNDFEALKLTPTIEIASVAKRSVISVTGSSIDVPFTVTADDQDKFSAIDFRVRTSKKVYDLMTDYPYMVLDPDKILIGSGGLELDSRVKVSELDKQSEGDFTLRITGAFTQALVPDWFFDLTEERVLKTALPVHSGAQALLETGQQLVVPVNLAKHKAVLAGYENCAVLKLSALGRLVQTKSFCP
jgi:subtilisin family serine protease